MVPSRPVFVSIVLLLVLLCASCAPQQATPAPTAIPAATEAPSCTTPNIETGVWTGSFIGITNTFREEGDRVKTALDLLRAHCVLSESGTPLAEYNAETHQLLLQVGDAVYPIEEWLAGWHDNVVYFDDTEIEWGIFPIPTPEATQIPGKP